MDHGKIYELINSLVNVFQGMHKREETKDFSEMRGLCEKRVDIVDTTRVQGRLVPLF